MSVTAFLRHFWRDLKSQKLRTLMTLFGIVWGTVAVTLLLAFGEGFHAQVKKSQAGLGENIVICWPGSTTKPWQGLPDKRRIRVTDEDIEYIRAQAPEISHISGEYRAELPIKVGKTVLVPGVTGATPEFGSMRNLWPQENGRFLNDLDMFRRRRVVFLGDKLKDDLFGGKEAVGQHVYVRGVPFLVVGIMEPKKQDSSYSGRDEGRLSLPASTLKGMLGRKYVNNFVFQVHDASQVETAKAKVVAALAQRYKFDPSDMESIMMWDTTEGMKFLDAFFIGFRSFMAIVGALTLVVGGIGVSNIMHVAVEERTKEIGLKMALGAKPKLIVGQFLAETLFFTLGGGLLGFVLSWGICSIFPYLGMTDFIGVPVISWKVALTTSTILGTIGLLAGYFPARSAAKLNPVEALRL